MNVYYVPGRDVHFADMLSRSSLKSTGEVDAEMLQMVHSITRHLPMSSERVAALRTATSKDDTLMKISEFYYNGWPAAHKVPTECKPFYALMNSIYIEAGIAFVDDKIIVPTNLREDMMKQLHKGHIGISKTIQKARTIFYWPNLSEDINTYIKKCRICEKYLPVNYKEPMLPHSVPTQRFNKVGADIMEFGGRAYLVVIDHFSHWMEIIGLSDKLSESVIDGFQEIFTRFGYPQYMVADNIPFLSSRCKEYYKSKDISITTCTPHYHQSNGLAEKAVNIGKQILRKCMEEKGDYRELLLEYNNAPITSLNASPAQILQSRSIRTYLPTTAENLKPKIQHHIYERLTAQKQKIKTRYDKKSRRSSIEYTTGDEVVTKKDRVGVWEKATVIEKARERRSYWIRKENNNRIMRRNTSQMKPSTSKPDFKFISVPQLHQDVAEDDVTVNCNRERNMERAHSGLLSIPTDLSNKVKPCNPCSRSGRPIRVPRRFDL